MSDTVTVTMRIDRDLKTESQMLLDSMGLDMTSAYTIFLKEVVRTGTIPFTIRSSYAPGKLILPKEEFERIAEDHRKAVESDEWMTIEQFSSRHGASE